MSNEMRLTAQHFQCELYLGVTQCKPVLNSKYALISKVHLTMYKCGILENTFSS